MDGDGRAKERGRFAEPLDTVMEGAHSERLLLIALVKGGIFRGADGVTSTSAIFTPKKEAINIYILLLRSITNKPKQFSRQFLKQV